MIMSNITDRLDINERIELNDYDYLCANLSNDQDSRSILIISLNYHYFLQLLIRRSVPAKNYFILTLTQ
jgi:hypothetical protein